MKNYDRVAALLDEQVKLGAPISYGKLASKAGLPPMDGAFKAHPLADIFDKLDRNDFPHPLRTTLVVTEETGIPGPGYFKTLAELRGKQILASERETVWLEQFQKLTAK